MLDAVINKIQLMIIHLKTLRFVGPVTELIGRFLSWLSVHVIFTYKFILLRKNQEKISERFIDVPLPEGAFIQKYENPFIITD